MCTLSCRLVLLNLLFWLTRPSIILTTRVLTMWHNSKVGPDDFMLWDRQMFADFTSEYGDVDVLICEYCFVYGGVKRYYCYF